MEIVIIIGLILFNGLLSMSEIALVSVRKSRLETESKNGNKSATSALKLVNEPDRFFSTIQIGITLVGILTGLYSGEAFAGDLAGPLINKSAIKAEFNTANAKQIQALYEYDKTVLNAYLEVANQMSKIDNLEKSYAFKQKQSEALVQSIDIANQLFKNNRADYLEVLMTQRDLLETKMQLIETKEKQLSTVVAIYKSLGGGWK